MIGGWESEQWYVHVLCNQTSWHLHRMYVQKMMMVLKVLIWVCKAYPSESFIDPCEGLVVSTSFELPLSY